MAKTILNENQKIILTTLSHEKVFPKKFYLSGGTALSEFYLHHRLSEDLDFFSLEEVDMQWLNTFSASIAKKTGAKRDIQTSYNRNLIFFNLNKDIIKTEFTFYPFPQIEKPKVMNNISIDSLTDIAVNKYFTIYQKPSARHFIDLFLILKTKNISWDELGKLARIKFDTHIDPIQLGSQLIRANTIRDLPKMLIKLPQSQWRSYFIERAKSLKNKVSQNRF